MNQPKRSFSEKIVSGMFWTAGGKGTQAILQFSVMLVMARYITPLEFGVVSAALVVVGFSEIVTRLGLGPALVQRSELETRHIGTAFSVSLLFSFGVAAVVWFSAPLIASFFDSLALVEVLRVLAWLFIIRGFGTVAESLAQRELQFAWLAKTDTISFVIGYFACGITLTVLGFGVWALVAANIAAAVVKTCALLVRYPPRNFALERAAFRELMHFGGGFTLARFANFTALQGDNIVVGRWLGLAALGLYGRAYQLMSVPASLFGQVLDEVLFPSMAKVQHDRKRLAAAYLRGVALVALVMLPLSVVVFVLAPEIVRVLLGDQWSEVIAPFRILTAGLLLRTSYKISDSLARATGAVYRRAWRQAIYAGAILAGAFVGQFWGVSGVAFGVLCALTVNFSLMAQMSLRLVETDWRNFFAAHRTAAFLASVTAIVVLPLAEFLRLLQLPPIFILLGSCAALLVYLLLILRFAPKLFFGVEGIWMLNILKNYVPDRFANRFFYAQT